MATAANKGKTLIYIHYNSETKPEMLLASWVGDEFVKVMLVEGDLVCGRQGETTDPFR